MGQLALIGLAVGTQLIGTAVQAAGQRRAGEAAEEDAKFEAEQMVARGKEDFAASQREALEARREGRLASSRAQAVAAASGAGAAADAPTIVRLMSGLSSRSEYGAQSAFYRGESQRKGLTDSANATLRTGRARKDGARLSAMGTIFSGIGGAFNTYSRMTG